ncbi:MAG: hypothetical protein DI533_10130 [Cereibacter sphaeroides]|uniref:Uncharacterized protein n=1 Tax=Cereibacter sphaeroides TaxID=1063 RepID=A0A2W5SMK4_CERSP|nr:MAG: hypothetical protein DI533_10130 [Cereibacter sphaeroides]
MSNTTARDADIMRLHPTIRDKVAKIQKDLQAEGAPFEVFEAFRTPERQAVLFAQGRTKGGPKVTWAMPWESMHQYGLAVDFVLRINGNWSWDDTGERGAFWARMHELAKSSGMTPLFNRAGKLIETPHIQLIGINSTDLAVGRYPEGGDEAWAEYMAEIIDGWDGPGAPPKPSGAIMRPALSQSDIADMETTAIPSREETNGISANAETESKFQRLHQFIKDWEGEFSYNPRDNGGATNMGITQATLAAWRNHEVSVEDVKSLTREEADKIFRSNYYSACRCGELPERIAMVVYNGAVLHGPKRSIELLQRAFNELKLRVDGKPLDEDGSLGRFTLAAAKQTNASVLADSYMDIQETQLRQHEDFDAFGKGWLNRLGALREFVNTLPKGAGARPSTGMSVTDRIKDRLQDLDLGDLDKLVTRDGEAQVLLGTALKEILKEEGNDSARTRIAKRVVTVLAEQATAKKLSGANTTASSVPPLTPVNAALGQTIGRMLNGKKSVIGIVGLLATVIVPHIGLTGSLVTFLVNNSTELLTILATFTGWGFLGKIDKAIWAVKQEVQT